MRTGEASPGLTGVGGRGGEAKAEIRWARFSSDAAGIDGLEACPPPPADPPTPRSREGSAACHGLTPADWDRIMLRRGTGMPGFSSVVVVGDWPPYRGQAGITEAGGMSLCFCPPRLRDLEARLRALAALGVRRLPLRRRAARAGAGVAPGLHRLPGAAGGRGPGDGPVPAEAGRDQPEPHPAGVLLLVAEGRRNREIAQALGVSPATVAYHLRQLLARLGVETRQEAVARAMRAGVL